MWVADRSHVEYDSSCPGTGHATRTGHHQVDRDAGEQRFRQRHAGSFASIENTGRRKRVVAPDGSRGSEHWDQLIVEELPALGVDHGLEVGIERMRGACDAGHGALVSCGHRTVAGVYAPRIGHDGIGGPVKHQRGRRRCGCLR